MYYVYKPYNSDINLMHTLLLWELLCGLTFVQIRTDNSDPDAFPHCTPTLWIRNFQWLIFFVYIFLSMLSGDFLLCQTFWSKYLWIFLAIYVDYSYFDAQVRCTYLVPNMTLTLMFNRNYNNLRYSIKKIKSLLEQKFFLLKSVCEFSLKHWQ